MRVRVRLTSCPCACAMAKARRAEVDHAAKSAVGMVRAMVATPPKPETNPEPKVRVDCHDTRASMAGSTAPC